MILRWPIMITVGLLVALLLPPILRAIGAH